MYHEPTNILGSNIYAYLLIDYKTTEILDGNLLARIFYKTTSSYPTLSGLFSPEITTETLSKVRGTLDSKGSVTLENVFSFTSDDQTFPCHIELCKVNDDMIFMIIKELGTYKDSQIGELMELKDNPIFVLENDENLTLCYGNNRLFRSVAIKKQGVSPDGSLGFLNLFPEETRKDFLNSVHEELEKFGECDFDFELTFDNEYYQMFHFHAYQSILDDRLYGVLISIKRQSELMKKIEYDQQYFDIMQKFSKDLLFRIDVKKSTLVHRGDISRFVGLSPEMEHFPESMRDINLIHPEDLDDYMLFAHQMMSGVDATFEPRFQFTNGTYEKYRLQASPLFDAQGNTVQIVGKCENIQKYVDIEAKAHYDSLTTALNKQSFRELVENMLQRAVSNDKFALLFLDLDNFKGVNDQLGHVFGDFLLETVGKRILNCVRKQDRVGRVGGDEFVIFFQFAPSHESVLERAEAILHSLRRDFNQDGVVCKMKASIGIAIYPEHGDNYETLYHLADKALYDSKAKGKDVATIYSEEKHG